MLPTKIIDETFWAWLAGFIDGKGCFMLVKSSTKHNKHRIQFIPVVVIAQKDLGVLNYIVEKVGYGIAYQQKNNTAYLKFTQRKARWILPHIIPHLQVKREKAELLYEACLMLKKGTYYGASGRPDSEHEKLLELSDRIRHAENARQPNKRKITTIKKGHIL